MSTLVAHVRELAGATEAEASDARIIEALTNTSAVVSSVGVVWEKYPSGAYTRTGRIPIGKYRVEATDAESSVTPIVLHSSAGVTDADLSATQLGIITTSEASGTLPTAYASGRAYDVYAAAAEIVDLRIVNAADAFDFKRGDQTFNRSQIGKGLRDLKADLLRRAIPRRRAEMVMRDQAAPRQV